MQSGHNHEAEEDEHDESGMTKLYVLGAICAVLFIGLLLYLLLCVCDFSNFNEKEAPNEDEDQQEEAQNDNDPDNNEENQ